MRAAPKRGTVVGPQYMQRDIEIGTVSWINERPSPIWFSGKAGVPEPGWVPKTYMGLVATANGPPPNKIDDF
jgi:hypothetical protein